MSEHKRKQHIIRVLKDLKVVIVALDSAMKEENPKWRILRCDVGGSLGKHLEGETELFKTPYSGLSGSEARGEEVPKGYLSDVDVVCWVTEDTDMWHKGNLIMHAESKIEQNPQKFLPRNRGRKCINFKGDEIESRYCSNPFWLPLDEPDLRKTHDVILHLKKPGEPSLFGLKWEKKRVTPSILI